MDTTGTEKADLERMQKFALEQFNAATRNLAQGNGTPPARVDEVSGPEFTRALAAIQAYTNCVLALNKIG